MTSTESTLFKAPVRASRATPSAALVAGALAIVAASAVAQVRVSQPLPTGENSGSGINADSGSAPVEAPATTTTVRGGVMAPASEAELAGGSTVATDEVGGGGDAELGLEGDEDLPRGGYDPEGRRDPFRALTGEAADSDLRKQYEGRLQGRLLSEVKLTSIVKTTRGNIATFEGGPKKEGYFARVGDKLWDGQVIEINYDSHTVVVRQQLNDPRLIKPFRDQVIALYGEDESAKPGSGRRPE
jgi:hypothetical protein